MSSSGGITFDIDSSSTTGKPRPVTLFVAIDSAKAMAKTSPVDATMASTKPSTSSSPKKTSHSLLPSLVGSAKKKKEEPVAKPPSFLEAAVAGASKVLDSLGDQDDAFVVSFGKEADVLTDGVMPTTNTNKESIKSKLTDVKTDEEDGDAKFYDIVVASTKGVLAAAAKQQERHGRSNSHERWLVIVTGSEDTSSASTLSSTVSLVESLKRQLGTDVMRIVIVGVSLGERAKSSAKAIKKAGGSMIEYKDVASAKELEGAFDTISERILKSRTAVPKSPSNEKDPDDEDEEEEEEEWEGEIQKGCHVRCVGCSRGAVQSVSIGDVGVVQKRDSDGDYIVNFPRKDGWYGRPEDIVVDEVAERVRPGALVRVKPAVTEPVCGWGSVTREMHGLVKEVKHDGAVKVLFGLQPDSSVSDSLWTSQLKELEVVDAGDFRGGYSGSWPGKLQLGMAVRVPARVGTPSTGWGNLKPGEVGYVRAFKSDTKSYVCDFPSIDGWQGREADLEMERVATLIRPGKEVRVRKGVEPSMGWAGVTADSVGRVLSCTYDGRFVTVKFPEHKSWKGRLSELETLDRPPTERATALNGSIDCPEYHGLREITIPENGGKTCDFCGRSGGPGDTMYTCSQCDVDACSTCYESQPPTAVASPTPSVASSNDVPYATAISPEPTIDISDMCASSHTSATVDTATFVDSERPEGGGRRRVAGDIDKLVLIKGLTSTAGMPFNGKLGEIMSDGDKTGLYTIKIVSSIQERVFKLRKDKFENAEDRLVELSEMDDPALNFKIGQIVGYGIASGLLRVNVKTRIMALPTQKVKVLPEPEELT